MALEKSIDIEKVFPRLKDNQIDEALSKVKKASTEAVDKFKVFDEYSDKLCDCYVEGFDLFWKYLAKHHSKLDFSKLDMEEVEKEILANHPTEAVLRTRLCQMPAKNVPTNPSPFSLP